MAKRSGVGWLLAGVTLLFGGVAVAASRTASTGRPRQEPDTKEPDPGTKPVPGFFDDVSGQQELRDPSVPDAAWSAKFQEHRNGFRDAVLLVLRLAMQAEAQQAIEKQSEKQSQELRSFTTKFGGAMAAAAGGYGVFVTAFLELANYTLFVLQRWGGHVLDAEGREFTGWRNGSWWFRDFPIYGPEASRFWPKLVEKMAFYSDQQKALSRLISAYPNGPGPDVVSVISTGDYEYRFNPVNPGNLSDAEKAAEHIRIMQVYSPADITLRGPRGFDPANPWGWKVPGERASVYDRAIKVDPSNEAAAL